VALKYVGREIVACREPEGDESDIGRQEEPNDEVTAEDAGDIAYTHRACRAYEVEAELSMIASATLTDLHVGPLPAPGPYDQGRCKSLAN
jgi:hypothetical protein